MSTASEKTLRLDSFADILNAAADLLEPEGAWIQGAFARDANRHQVYYGSSDACCWCVSGAIRKVAGTSMIDAQPVLDYFTRFIRVVVLSRWNDCQKSSKPILKALRGAAAKLTP